MGLRTWFSSHTRMVGGIAFGRSVFYMFLQKGVTMLVVVKIVRIVSREKTLLVQGPHAVYYLKTKTTFWG